MTIRFCIILSLILVNEACADIYKYVTEDGVECFTDSPTRKDAVLVLKEHVPPRKFSSTRSPLAKRQASAYMKKYSPATRKAAAGALDVSGTLPVNGRITSLVGTRSDPIDGLLRFHNGVDIAVPQGTPVRPVAAGTVIYCGNRSGYGNMIMVEHQDGMTTIYAHHSVNTATIGQQVGKDTVIAYSGSTGRSSGPHLFFGVRWHGARINPQFLLEDPAKIPAVGS